VRIAILLLILVIVALQTWGTRYRATRWTVPLFVAIYPIAADESPATRAYVATLSAAEFQPIDRFFAREASRYGLAAREPVRTRLRAELHELPPQRPAGAGVLGTMLWSLRLRYWAWRITVNGHVHDPEDIQIFVLYHDPALSPTLPHSLGLSKGLLGVVYAFAAPWMSGTNDVVIAHELLHTLGATDKYDLADDSPRFPDGYGDPRQVPLYPQRMAELMAGRRMIAPDRWEQATDLESVLIGPASALEIRWPPPASGPPAAQ
jgi:hypothetical protein